jgi:hypothetical protein
MPSYLWPNFRVSRFELYAPPNVRVFTGPYTPAVQSIDLMGERWVASLELTGRGKKDRGINAAAREAFFDRLRGPVNTIELWHLGRPSPLGTFGEGNVVNVVNGSGQPVTVVNGSGQTVLVTNNGAAVATTAAKGASTLTLSNPPGRTLYPGDMLGVNGQLIRLMTGGTFDANGRLAVEIWPRMRAAVAAYSIVTYNKPTARFRLRSGDSVPTAYRPGGFEGTALELIEAI